MGWTKVAINTLMLLSDYWQYNADIFVLSLL